MERTSPGTSTTSAASTPDLEQHLDALDVARRALLKALQASAPTNPHADLALALR